MNHEHSKSSTCCQLIRTAYIFTYRQTCHSSQHMVSCTSKVQQDITQRLAMPEKPTTCKTGLKSRITTHNIQRCGPLYLAATPYTFMKLRSGPYKVADRQRSIFSCTIWYKNFIASMFSRLNQHTSQGPSTHITLLASLGEKCAKGLHSNCSIVPHRTLQTDTKYHYSAWCLQSNQQLCD
jgi:hypothetical protein